MRARIVRLIAIVAWVGVALDGLLLVQVAWPNASLRWALGPLMPLLPHRRAVDAAALGLLFVADLLHSAGRARADYPRLSTPPAEEGELRWPQPFGGLRQSDGFARALVVYGGAQPALFVAAAVLLFLIAPTRQPLLFVAILAHFAAQRLGHWATMRRLMRAGSYTALVSPRGVAAAATFVAWEDLSCFETAPAQGRFVVFGRPLPRPPLIALEPPPELAGRVLAALRERLSEATAKERAAWRRREPAWVAGLSAPFLVAGVAVAGAFLLHDRTLAGAGLVLAFLLCERWFWGLARRIMGLAPAPGAPQLPAGEEAAIALSPALAIVSRLLNVTLVLGLAALAWAAWAPAWGHLAYAGLASYSFLIAALVLSVVEYIIAKSGRRRSRPGLREEV